MVYKEIGSGSLKPIFGAKTEHIIMSTPIVSKDLTKRAPKSPRERIGGFVIAGRAIDKCRASLDGNLGDYHFDCLLDKVLFTFKGITAEQFKAVVAAAKTYEEVGEWLLGNGTSRTALEVKAWSDKTEASSLMNNAEKRAYFIESCSRLMMNPEMTTTFDWLEGDDARTSWPTAPANPVSVSTDTSRLSSSTGDQNIKAPVASPAETPVFGKVLHTVRQRTVSQPEMPGNKSNKRNNTFSKSRDTREDRGTRQAKTMNRSRTQSRGR
jgi:hypothetical protein